MYGSFLELLVEDIRLALGDPTVGAQFTDDQILRKANAAMQRVFMDVQRVSSKPLVLTADIVLTTGTTVYQLPPSMGTLIEIGGWDSESGRWAYTLYSTSRKGPYRPGLFLSGRCMTFDHALDREITLRIEYKPNGDFLAHEGQRTFVIGTLGASAFALIDSSTAPIRGSVDDRQNAYVGALLRVWPSSTALAEVQERRVIAHVLDANSADKERLLTVDVPFSPALEQDGNVIYQYELVHESAEGLRECVVLQTAIAMCSLCGELQRKNALILDYRVSMRNARLSEANADSRRQKWQKDTMYGVFGS